MEKSHESSLPSPSSIPLPNREQKQSEREWLRRRGLSSQPERASPTHPSRTTSTSPSRSKLPRASPSSPSRPVRASLPTSTASSSTPSTLLPASSSSSTETPTTSSTCPPPNCPTGSPTNLPSSTTTPSPASSPTPICQWRRGQHPRPLQVKDPHLAHRSCSLRSGARQVLGLRGRRLPRRQHLVDRPRPRPPHLPQRLPRDTTSPLLLRPAPGRRRRRESPILRLRRQIRERTRRPPLRAAQQRQVPLRPDPQAQGPRPQRRRRTHVHHHAHAHRSGDSRLDGPRVRALLRRHPGFRHLQGRRATGQGPRLRAHPPQKPRRPLLLPRRLPLCLRHARQEADRVRGPRAQTVFLIFRLRSRLGAVARLRCSNRTRTRTSSFSSLEGSINKKS